MREQIAGVENAEVYRLALWKSEPIFYSDTPMQPKVTSLKLSSDFSVNKE